MTIARQIAECLPVTVSGQETNDPMFAVFGENTSWALSVACPWTISGPGYEYRWDGETFELAMARLVGAQLMSVEIGDDLIDPVFFFSGELRLEVHADSDQDPWVFRLPGMDFVLVGLAH